MSHRNNARGFSKRNNEIYSMQKFDKNTEKIEVTSGYSKNPYSCSNKRLNPYKTIDIDEKIKKEILCLRAIHVENDIFTIFSDEKYENQCLSKNPQEKYIFSEMQEIVGDYLDKNDLIDKIIEKNRNSPIEFINDKIAKELSTFYTEEECPICSEKCFDSQENYISMKITSCCRNLICNPCITSWSEKIRQNVSCPFCRYSPIKLYSLIPIQKYIKDSKEYLKKKETSKLFELPENLETTEKNLKNLQPLMNEMTTENDTEKIIVCEPKLLNDTSDKNNKIIQIIIKIGVSIKNCIKSIKMSVYKFMKKFIQDKLV